MYKEPNHPSNTSSKLRGIAHAMVESNNMLKIKPF
jgi:hypothetical protein